MSFDTVKSPLNFDRFEIIKTGVSFWPSLVVAGGGAGGFATGEAITTIAHGLGFTPVVVAYLQEVNIASTQNFAVPSFSFFGAGSSVALWINFRVAADSTNFYIITDLMSYGVTASSTLLGGAAGGFKCQYYLMLERVKRSS
jgi:hypothetical protein